MWCDVPSSPINEGYKICIIILQWFRQLIDYVRIIIVFFLNLYPELKMAVHRFQMASNKKSALLKQNMREVAVLLAEDPPKEEKARIKAEALIRDDYVSA